MEGGGKDYLSSHLPSYDSQQLYYDSELCASVRIIFFHIVGTVASPCCCCYLGLLMEFKAFMSINDD